MVGDGVNTAIAQVPASFSIHIRGTSRFHRPIILIAVLNSTADAANNAVDGVSQRVGQYPVKVMAEVTGRGYGVSNQLLFVANQ